MAKSRFWHGIADDAVISRTLALADLMPPGEIALAMAMEVCRPDGEGRVAAARLVHDDGCQRCLIALISNKPMDRSDASHAMLGVDPTASAAVGGLLAFLSDPRDGFVPASEIAYVGDFPRPSMG